MSKQQCIVSFPGTSYSPITLEAHQKLSEHLTAQNSPVLFGCRTGICGTCLVLVNGEISPPSAEEREVLEVLAPEHPNARLACQLELTSNLEMMRFQE